MSGILVLTVAGCSGGGAPQAARNQPAAGSYGSDTAYQGASPSVSPNDPAYSENGARRPGQPSGTNSAGAPMENGNYAPLQHPDQRR